MSMPSDLPPAQAAGEAPVQHYRQILLWPVRLLMQDHPLAATGPAVDWLKSREGLCHWQEWQTPGLEGAPAFEERHYQEFVTFLPYVQRFLYGEGGAPGRVRDAHAGPSMRVFRRQDISSVRVWLPGNTQALTLRVERLDLHFFHDIDVAVLSLELAAEHLSVVQVQELLYRLGRTYPSGWEEDAHPLHCVSRCEWLGPTGEVLCVSDSGQREQFLQHVGRYRAPRMGRHWAFLLEPLVAHHSGDPGPVSYRHIDYYRMPVMAYVALQQPEAISHEDMVRMGLAKGAHAGVGPAFDEASFSWKFCDDRHWHEDGPAPWTRYVISGTAVVVVGSASSSFFRCAQRGVQAQFCHPHYLIFLIAHLQKAALLMISDRLVEALRSLDVQDAENVKRFKRAIRASFEGFLRFTHRYWFHEVAEQALARSLYENTTQHLQTRTLYQEVKTRISDMADYLETDSIRRQANTVVRLTVVTIFGLIGTITTGFLGMNLLAEAEAPLWKRLVFFAVVIAVTTALTVYTMVKSKKLSDFLDALSDERLSAWEKCKAFLAVWKEGHSA
jgi:hypothetical protein